MAVEIPVVIDIDKAFEDAARRVETAISPLKRAIDRSTSELKIDLSDNFDFTDVRKLGDLLKDVGRDTGEFTMKLQTLEIALGRVKASYNRLATIQAHNGSLSSGQRQAMAEYAEAIIYLESEINLRRSSANLISEQERRQERVKDAINRGNAAMEEEAKTIAELNDKISALRGKLDNLNPSSSKKEWRETTREIRKATEELAKYKSRLDETTKPGSIARLKSEMAKLDQQWNAMSKRQKFDADGSFSKSAQRIIDKYKKLTEESEKYGQSLSKVASGAKPKIESTTNALRSQSTVLRNLASYASMYFSVFGLIRFAKQIRDVTGELEYQRVALGHLIQDEEYGARIFERIKEAAIQSPFQISQLVTYTKQLAAYRIEQENLFDTTSRLADISAGLGVQMSRLILAYGQVRAASVLRGQELRQFTEAGIPLVELLADKMGELHDTTYRTADVFKLISERAVPFSAISEIFEDLTSKGGMFYKMQEEQAKTLKGRWEKLKDAFSIGLQAAGETQTFIWQNNLLLNTLTLLAKNVRFVPKLIESLSAAWLVYTIATMKSTRATKAARIAQIQLSAEELKDIAAKNLSKAATDRLTRAMIRQKAATNAVSRSFWKLRAAMIAHPYAAIAAAVAGLITLFVTWRKKTQEQSESFKDLTQAIEDVSKSEKTYERMKKQISAYERLASKTERTAKENVELARTLSVLREEFPGVTLTVDQTNEKLGETIAKLKELNKSNRLEGIQKAFRARNMAQLDAKKLKDEIDAQTKAQDVAWTQYERYIEIYGEGSKQAKEQKKAYEDIGQQLAENNKTYIQTLKYIEALDKYINPKEDTGLTTWQRTMMSMKDFTVGGKKINLIGDGDIQGYESLYKGLQKIDKIYQDATNSAKEMKAGLSSVKEEYRETAEEEIAVTEGRRDAAKAILDTFGYVSKIDKKKDTSSLAILKEELKNVQEIYKRYKEFLKYMSASDAEKKIKEIYGGVTAIDFLSPETYKKRLADLLAELRKMQGRVKTGAKQLTVEMANDLKDMLRGNEGFSSKAYKLKGEKAYTIGYGFYNKLVDGTEITKDMSMTIEEAEKELDKQVERTVKLTNALLAKYGNGLELTERQFNILADLAYQGPGVLKRALQEANGDAEKLAETLENAAWPYVAKSMQEAVKTRDLRRATLFRIAGVTSEEEAKEITSAIFNLERIVQDVDWDEFKDVIENKIKTLSDEIKKSSEVRNFFKNIFEATGDKDIATNLTMSIYGNLGTDLEKKLKDQLSAAFVLDDKKLADAGLSVAQANADVAEAILKNDYNMLSDYLKYVTDANKDNADKLLSDRIKDNAEWYKDFVKTYAKARTYQERVDTLNMQRESEKKEAKKRGVDEAGIKAIDTFYDRKIADVQIEAMKDTYTWTKTFENLDRVSSRTLKSLIALIDEYIEKYGKDLEPQQLKELTRARENARAQQLSRNSYTGVFAAFKKLNDAKKKENILERAYMKNTEHYNQILDDEQSAVEDLAEAFRNLQADMDQAFSITKDLMGVFASDDDASYFGGQLDNISKIFAGVGGATAGIAGIFANPADINSWKRAIQGVSDLIVGIFNAAQAKKIRDIDNQLEEQDKILNSLERSYDQLEKAIAKAFGSDYIYNYNEQLDILMAKQQAYAEQSRLEAEKGKKADQKKIEEYDKAALDAQDQIAEMKGKLAEFFTSTELTSAAKDFASAWIDAYKEFGSTTDAMKEKFQEMVQSMIEQSLGAKIMKTILQPLFDEIDAMAQTGGELSAQEIAQIGQMAPEYIDKINDAMTNLMTQLAAAGYNVRQQVGGFTGISRDIAGASEESINGLAAGINTQNFYMSLISQNVASILAALTGSPVEGATGAGTPDVTDPYKDQMLLYAGSLPQMRDDMYAIRSMLEKVVRPNGTNATHYVAVRM